MKARVEKGLPRLRSVRTDVPETVEEIVAKCLEVDAANRYQTPAELGTALNRLDDQGEIIPEPRRLTPRLIVAAAALVAVLLGGTYFVGRRAQALAQHEPVPVLVADFDNRSGDPVFEGSVEQALVFALKIASYISVFKTTDARAR